MLAQKCNNDCGFVRPGSVAYRKFGIWSFLLRVLSFFPDGFGGGDKAFLLEFSMPMDGSSGFNAGK